MSADLPPDTRLPGRWFRVTALFPRDREDAWTGLAWAAGARGTMEEPAGGERLRAHAWFDGGEEAGRFARSLPRWVEETTGPVAVADPGWLEASLAAREPVAAGPFLVVAAPVPGRPPGGRIPLVLPPGRAFGTGEHPTTRMCLELVGEALRPGDRVLDLGTGSGILAIAAALLGAGPVVALDADPTVPGVARENARRNGCAGRIAFAAGSWQGLSPGARFDLVLANLHRSDLVAGAEPLAERLAPGGRAVLSGFSPGDADPVTRAWMAAGLRRKALRRDGEWAALLLARPGEEP